MFDNCELTVLSRRAQISLSFDGSAIRYWHVSSTCSPRNIGALLIGAISPGPSFVLVSRIAITRSRWHGLAAAAGMGAGGTLFATLVFLGLSALLNQVEILYTALKLAGGLYLVWLGTTIWRGARQVLVSPEIDVPQGQSLLRAFFFALLTQLSNPKTAVV